MTTIFGDAKTITADPHVRMFDVRRDLGPVADLIELCFSDTLDPDGREYLNRMRSAADHDSWLGLAASVEWMHPSLTGYVWQEGERITGNASLIPFFANGRRNYLIANVAVHPEARRRGIGRVLTTECMDYAFKHGSQTVLLHVRHDNPAAIRLYEGLGFAEIARRTTWQAPAARADAPLPPAELPAAFRFTTPNAQTWNQQRAWLTAAYPSSVIWHTAIRLPALRPGLLGDLMRFFYAITLRQWGVTNGRNLQAAVAWQLASGYAQPLYLAAPPDCPTAVVQGLLLHARRQLRSPRPLALEYPADLHREAIAAAGFTEQQTLIWMEKGR